MDTLELLAGHAEPLRLTDVASELKLPVSSTHVLLQSLVEREYVCVSDEERRYGVDRGLIALALRVLDRLTIIETAKPVMAALAARTREDVYLGAPIGREIVYVAKVEGALSPRLGIQLASDRPLHATSVGKLYLAMLPDDELERRLAEIELVRFTPHTITNPTVLRAELTAIRHEGCAVTDGEHLEGIAAAAAAIVDASGAFVGALSLSVSRSRFHENAPNLLADLVDAAAQVSADLAAHNPTATVAEPRRELADSTS